MKYIFLEAYIPYKIIHHKISPVQFRLGSINNEWIKLRWINHQIKSNGKCHTVDFH